MYGMGTASIASSLNCSIEEAESIKNGFFNEFPDVKNWIEKTEKDAHKNGYVEDVWGRRRRLPDILLDRYEIKLNNSSSDFNPILGSIGKYSQFTTITVDKIKKALSEAKYRKDIDKIKKESADNGIQILDNGGFIAQAERQCVNTRIQGGAASMSKKAMISVFNDDELNKLGFRLLIAVHDELIGECPEENKDKVKERLSYLMINAAKPEVDVPMKCDADDFKSWYLDVYASEVLKRYNKLIKENSKEDTLNIIYEEFEECTKEQLDGMIYE